MRSDYKDRLLIISNSVLSSTRGNGKTILSYFDCLPKQCVRQLYFSTETPTVGGYEYYQLNDKDIIRGQFCRKKRGRAISGVKDQAVSDFVYKSARIKTPFFRIMRECLWFKKWKSPQLIKWLDDYMPTSVFFVGGDSIFAYAICKYICERFRARISLYITDDYIMPRHDESLLSKLRRSLVAKKMKACAKNCDVFFTISRPMQKAYGKLFGKESHLIVNMPSSLKRDATVKDNASLTMVYAGSLYYGRENMIAQIAHSIQRYNSQNNETVYLKIFANTAPEESVLKKIEVEGASGYCGSLGQNELIEELNEADILVFVESFDEEEKEKTRFSLSTKVPEYLSLGKPIFAVGPGDIGSMDYLSDVAACVNDESKIYDALNDLVNDKQYQKRLGEKAEAKYYRNHDKKTVQANLIDLVLGSEA